MMNAHKISLAGFNNSGLLFCQTRYMQCEKRTFIYVTNIHPIHAHTQSYIQMATVLNPADAHVSRSYKNVRKFVETSAHDVKTTLADRESESLEATDILFPSIPSVSAFFACVQGGPKK